MSHEYQQRQCRKVIYEGFNGDLESILKWKILLCNWTRLATPADGESIFNVNGVMSFYFFNTQKPKHI